MRAKLFIWRDVFKSLMRDYLMITKYAPGLILLAYLIAMPSFSAEREIAITIDDLPFVGTDSNNPGNLARSHDRFMKIVQSLIDHHVPATGFVIAGAIGKGQWQLLEEFRKEGFELGNHTYSHANLNRISTEKYMEEIAHADQKLSNIMTQPKYFRYPYLAEGKGAAKQEIQDFLTANQYTIAPVTIDSKDYQFNARLLQVSWRVRAQHLSQIKREYLDYIWKQTLLAEKKSSNAPVKQILLIHANLLNSHFLGDVIQMYKDHGYHFVSLGEALNNTTQVTQKEEVADQLSTRDIMDMDKVW